MKRFESVVIIFVIAMTSPLFSEVEDWGLGLNLPATQGSSNAGNFEAGVFPFDYSTSILERIKRSSITRLRLSLNVETARSGFALRRLESLASLTDFHGILCMWDTNEKGETDHGNGLPNDLDELAEAWKSVHARFARYPHLRYEIFNEPFGYPRNANGAKSYLNDMRRIIKAADLPEDRCLLNGLGYADNVRIVSEAGWGGALAYHIYPNWLPDKNAKAADYAKVVQDALSGLPNEVVITEFGTNLRLTGYTESNTKGAASLLLGIRNGIQSLRENGSRITGAYHWHGRDNGDSYSFWHPENRAGARFVYDLRNIHSLPDACHPQSGDQDKAAAPISEVQ